MPRLSDDQVKQARSVDLLSYLQTYEPGSVRKSGANEYCLVKHDSFKISNGMYFWHSRGFGGQATALDYLVKVCGVPFVDAVERLTAGKSVSFGQMKVVPEKTPQPKPKKPFVLPTPNKNNDRVVAYLRSRGICKDIIYRCINVGFLYESEKHRCVFVGKDGDRPKFACERGIEDDWKRDVSGSDKRFSFALPPENPCNSSTLAAFESAIDSLAHYSIYEIEGTGWDGYRLALGGVGSLALFSFLERNPQITDIQLCLDSDKAGIDATKRIIGELRADKRFCNIKVTVTPSPIGKDFADAIKTIQQSHMKQHQISRPNVTAI